MYNRDCDPFLTSGFVRRKNPLCHEYLIFTKKDFVIPDNADEVLLGWLKNPITATLSGVYIYRDTDNYELLLPGMYDNFNQKYQQLGPLYGEGNTIRTSDLYAMAGDFNIITMEIPKIIDPANL